VIALVEQVTADEKAGDDARESANKYYAPVCTDIRGAAKFTR
jgi:hypothetical protein